MNSRIDYFFTYDRNEVLGGCFRVRDVGQRVGFEGIRAFNEVSNVSIVKKDKCDAREKRQNPRERLPPR